MNAKEYFKRLYDELDFDRVEAAQQIYSAENMVVFAEAYANHKKTEWCKEQRVLCVKEYLNFVIEVDWSTPKATYLDFLDIAKEVMLNAPEPE